MAAAAALLFAGCGGDDEPTAEQRRESTPAAESTPSRRAADGRRAAAAPRRWRSKPTRAATNAFTETELTATAGQVTVEFSNPSQSPHAVVIEGVEPSTETVTAADAPPITVDLEAGEYTFFCPVGNHRADGMEGTLTVQ